MTLSVYSSTDQPQITNKPHILPNTGRDNIDGRWLPKTWDAYGKMIGLLFEYADYFPNGQVPQWLQDINIVKKMDHTVVRYKGNTLAAMWYSLFLSWSKEPRSDAQWNTRFGEINVVSADVVAIEEWPSSKWSGSWFINIHTKKFYRDIEWQEITQRESETAWNKHCYPEQKGMELFFTYKTVRHPNAKQSLVDKIEDTISPFSYNGQTSFDQIYKNQLGNIIIKDGNKHIILASDATCLYDSEKQKTPISKHRNYEYTNSFGHFVFDNEMALVPSIDMVYNVDQIQTHKFLGNIVIQNNSQSWQSRIFCLDTNTYWKDPEWAEVFDDIAIHTDYVIIIKWNSGKKLLIKSIDGSIVYVENPLDKNKMCKIHASYNQQNIKWFRIRTMENKEYWYIPGEEGEWFHTKHREEWPSAQAIEYSWYCIIAMKDGKYKLIDKNLRGYEVWATVYKNWVNAGDIFDKVDKKSEACEFQWINRLTIEANTEDQKKILHVHSKNCRPHT